MKTLRISKEVELLLGVVGAAQGIFLSVYMLMERHKNYKNVLLGFLFVALTLRILKSLLWVYLDAIPDWLINLGFIAHSASGPLLFLYTYSFIFNCKGSLKNVWHFLPSALLLAGMFSLTLQNFWYAGGYALLLFQQLAYGLASIGLLIYALNRKNGFTASLTDKKNRWWLLLLVGCAFVIQTAYFTNYILGLTPYLLGPVAYGIFIYFISFFGWKNPQIFHTDKGKKKYSNIHLSRLEVQQYKERIQNLMTQKKPYLANNCSIGEIADSMELPVYVVSHVINKEFYKNFPDFINYYRIQEAQCLLKKKEFSHLKIASIAHDCGFNSLSSFNKAFKKVAGVTPSFYRDNE